MHYNICEHCLRFVDKGDALQSESDTEINNKECQPSMSLNKSVANHVSRICKILSNKSYKILYFKMLCRMYLLQNIFYMNGYLAEFWEVWLIYKIWQMLATQFHYKGKLNFWHWHLIEWNCDKLTLKKFEILTLAFLEFWYLTLGIFRFDTGLPLSGLW